MRIAFAETSNNDHDYGRGVSLDKYQYLKIQGLSIPSDKPDVEAPTDVPNLVRT